MITEEDNLDQAIDNESITFNDRLVYDKLTFYYISLPILLLGNILGALLLSAMQLNSVDMYTISVWLLISFIMFLYQIYHYYVFKNETEENKLKDANIWLDKYYTNILLNGIIWGSTAFLMFPDNDLMHQMIMMLFLFAISFSAMGVLASKKDLLLTYVLVAYAPLVARLFFMEGAVYLKMAYAVLALVLIMILVANYYGKVINQSLGNRQHFMTIKHTHEKLKERFFSLFERAPVGIYYYNKNLELQDVNTHFMNMNKVQSKDSLLNLDLRSLVNAQIIHAHEDILTGKTGHYRGPFEVIDSKTHIYTNLSTVPMLDSDGNIAGGITIINDITNEVTAKEEMVRNAYYDMLTNIPNRTLLMDKLKSFIASKHNDQTYASLLFMDIDNFKKVNETYGHDAGDNILKQVVHRIERVIENNEIFARLGGDKFVILLPMLDTDHLKSEKMAQNYIDRINKYFIQPLNLAGDEYHLSFTVGVILFNDYGVTAYDILKRAETAMYEAKKSIRGTSQFYQKSMGNKSKENLTLENDIHKAITNNEFSIFYQPQLDIKTNKIIAAEALIRWNHPTKGLVSPSIFIPIAEESGSIIKLEEWIFDKALQEISILHNSVDNLNLTHIAINISTIHFLQPHFVEKLMLLLQKYHVKPEWVELELTESGIMRNIHDAVRKIKELKAFGFTFSIDDFGTGYSSLSYLKELPVDMIKIDQSFIFSMNENKGDAMIVESVVAISQKFNLKVLAEGVENQETLTQLSHIKCDFYQGYFAYEALPFEVFKQLLNTKEV